MKFLITGAAGGIGSLLSQRLQKLGHSTVLVDNLRNGFLQNLRLLNVDLGDFHNLDIRNINTIQGKYKKIDAVFHLAAISSLSDCEMNKSECISINVEGTVCMLEFARKIECKKFIFASSSAVYENNIEEFLTEELPIKPKLFYSNSKKMAEDACMSFTENYGLPTVIPRLFNVFGPYQDLKRINPPLVNYIVREYMNNRIPILHSNGRQVRDYISVYDVVDFLCISATKSNTGIYNVCSQKLFSVREIVAIIQKTMNLQIQPIYRDGKHLWDDNVLLFEGHYSLKREIVAKETEKFVQGSNKKAKSDFGWEPKRDVKDELELTVRQILANES